MNCEDVTLIGPEEVVENVKKQSEGKSLLRQFIDGWREVFSMMDTTGKTWCDCNGGKTDQAK